ncbi:glycosyltransferase family 4 protein [Mucilaginibacter kameinonensis]|uniref:glycosyltransferase family 4 protein n=1 Tax=Mucilaginibacter kameinonensis TaxID=452286 RepID=UPI000EF83ABC|nr:glycosyltransferase family 4 protein [Mucilaginibacter kameinonensis]
MKVIYTSPNSSHHYRYARMLHEAGVLHKFVSGFSRLSPRAALDELGDELVRKDFLQTVYLVSLRSKIPVSVSRQIAYLAKIEQDNACKRYLDGADIFMYYNGSGLNTSKAAKKKGKIVIVEAVNSHVQYQEDLMKEEYESLGLPWVPFYAKEKARRLAEYQLADYILLPSNFVKRSFIQAGFPEKMLLRVPYGFSQLTSDIIENAENEQREFVVLYVGSISVRKGLRYLIKAFEQLDHPHKKLMIVGPENNPNGLNDIVIPEGVVFTGILKGEQLNAAYRGASVFCLPSIEEGLALVLGEALSFGVPIIATDNTGADDIITNGEEGFIVPIRDSNSIREKLQLLADDKDAYNAMKEKAVKKAGSLKGWDETGRLLVASLNDVFTARV